MPRIGQSPFNRATPLTVLPPPRLVFYAIVKIYLQPGLQWVFADKVVLDLYYGFGYGIDNKKDPYDDYYYYEDATAFNYANARLGKSPGFSASFGLKIGVLLK